MRWLLWAMGFGVAGCWVTAGEVEDKIDNDEVTTSSSTDSTTTADTGT